jgi:hypothetical protein
MMLELALSECAYNLWGCAMRAYCVDLVFKHTHAAGA